MDWARDFLFLQGLPPHGYCLLWDPRLVWTHVIADALIAAAYFSIPLVLWLFLRQRKDIEFGWVLALFALFIFACGATHVIGILVLWVPAYGLQAAVKVVTAIASIGTAVALWPLLPKLVAMPSHAELQSALGRARAEAEERERAEEMLRQAQKMHAIGQLTAGIAHDFNNLLTVIGGNLDRLERVAPDEPRIRASLANAQAASERAGRLTHQLLAFARKQPLVTRPVVVKQAIRELLPLLERTAGEHIAVRLRLAPGNPTIVADRNQLESAILNLALNARDAMADGGAAPGELTVATGLEGNGDVTIAVSDTGEGMSEETISRATEPFFTTKPVGSGTGLGLSQVYGFMTQSGGSLDIASAPGRGTTVRLRFPGEEAA